MGANVSAAHNFMREEKRRCFLFERVSESVVSDYINLNQYACAYSAVLVFVAVKTSRNWRSQRVQS
jgi:hypothetical protein